METYMKQRDQQVEGEVFRQLMFQQENRMQAESSIYHLRRSLKTWKMLQHSWTLMTLKYFLLPQHLHNIMECSKG